MSASPFADICAKIIDIVSIKNLYRPITETVKQQAVDAAVIKGKPDKRSSGMLNDADSEVEPWQPGTNVTASVKSRLCSRFNTLMETMEPDYGLLDELLSTELISMKQYRDVISRTTTDDRNWFVLRCLIDEKTDEDCDRFLTALRSTDQHHVVNLIHSDCTGNYGRSWTFNHRYIDHFLTCLPFRA